MGTKSTVALPGYSEIEIRRVHNTNPYNHWSTLNSNFSNRISFVSISLLWNSRQDSHLLSQSLYKFRFLFASSSRLSSTFSLQKSWTSFHYQISCCFPVSSLLSCVLNTVQCYYLVLTCSLRKQLWILSSAPVAPFDCCTLSWLLVDFTFHSSVFTSLTEINFEFVWCYVVGKATFMFNLLCFWWFSELGGCRQLFGKSKVIFMLSPQLLQFGLERVLSRYSDNEWKVLVRISTCRASIGFLSSLRVGPDVAVVKFPR